MARTRRSAPTPVWVALLVPIVQWVGLAGILVAVGIVIAQETRPPSVLQEEAARAAMEPLSDYSLQALHERLPPEGVERVQRYLEQFQGRQRRRVERGLSRSTRYLELYRDIFANHGMPRELAYLPLIESGFTETAVSPAKAAGMWQFIEETGRRYNLQRNYWSDKRLDPIQSARAAALYLKHLYEEFRDWELALAAYNAGAGTVRWAIRLNERQDRPTHYWALDLPEETRNYVPAFIAAVLIAKNPGAYGFNEIDFHPRIAYEYLKVAPGVSLRDLAANLDVSAKVLLDLNPYLIRATVPPGEEPYPLRVPVGLRRDISARLTGQQPAVEDWMLQPVEGTRSLSTLASQLRVPVSRLRKVNRLQSDAELLKRPYLIVPL